jgi:hypothetical protein
LQQVGDVAAKALGHLLRVTHPHLAAAAAAGRQIIGRQGGRQADYKQVGRLMIGRKLGPLAGAGY